MRVFPCLILLLCLCSGTGYGQTRTVGLMFNDSAAVNGYTLFSNSRITYLIDNCGYVVHSWESDYPTLSTCYLLENGNLLRSARINGAFFGGGLGGRLELFDWNGGLLWSYDYATDTTHQHHDIQPLPNGNILVLAWESKTREQAIAAGRRPDILDVNGVWPEQIAEIKPLGINQAEVVWEWHLWDHLIQDFDAAKANFGVVAEHPERMDINYVTIQGTGNGALDWIHANAINYNPELDQILISSRVLSEVWIIDHGTTTQEAAGHSGGRYGRGGDLLYRWGNPATYRRGGLADRLLFGQHDARWIPAGYPNAGKIMVFNNGSNRPNGSFSSVDIWTPPADSAGFYHLDAGAPYGPGFAEWSYAAPGFFSANISGAHPLENGNIFICEGQEGRFFEITPNKKTVWEYVNPVSNTGPVAQGQVPANNTTFRATRYAPGYPAFAGKDLVPGVPVELNPGIYDCTIYDGTVSAGTATVPTLRVYANPVSDVLLLRNAPADLLQVDVFDAAGRLLHRSRTSDEDIRIPARNWPAGMLLVRLQNLKTGQIRVGKAVKR